MLLEAKGQVVEATYDGASALEQVERFQPDLVLLDLGLPGMDGFAVARHIRRSSRGDVIRLIAVTGWAQDEDKARAEAAGFDDHLAKPVDAAKLGSVLVSLDCA